MQKKLRSELNIRSDAINLDKVGSRQPQKWNAESSNMSKASHIIATKTSNNIGQKDPNSTYKVVLKNISPQKSRQAATLMVGTDYTIGMSEALEDKRTYDVSASKDFEEKKVYDTSDIDCVKSEPKQEVDQ